MGQRLCRGMNREKKSYKTIFSTIYLNIKQNTVLFSDPQLFYQRKLVFAACVPPRYFQSLIIDNTTIYQKLHSTRSTLSFLGPWFPKSIFPSRLRSHIGLAFLVNSVTSEVCTSLPFMCPGQPGVFTSYSSTELLYDKGHPAVRGNRSSWSDTQPSLLHSLRNIRKDYTAYTL